MDPDNDLQLPFALDADERPDHPELPARISLPLAAAGHAPFDDEGYFFEPWWPGAHAALRRDGDRIAIRTEHLADPLLALPDLVAIFDHLDADGVIVEGTLLALDADGRPDERLLRRRLAASGDPDEVAAGMFVATDIPYLDGASLARLPFVERRRRLVAVLHGSDHGVIGRGIIGEGRRLGRAAASLGLRAISAHRIDARWKGGPAGDTWLRLPVVESPSGPPKPFLELMQRLPLED